MMKLLKRTQILVALTVVLGWSSLASADVINGSFYLTVNQPNAQGGTVFRGSYETEDTSDATNIASVDGVNYVQLAGFSLTGIFQSALPFPAPFGGSTTLAFDLNNFLNSSETNQSGSAVLNSAGTVAYLSGDAFLLNISSLQAFSLSLGGDLTTPNNGDWSLGGGLPILGYNGDQTIPEPSILGLMGAGLFGFGVISRRRRKSLSA